MTFVYPVIITPHTEDAGFHAEFPDLEMCEADGRDLDEALDRVREAGNMWISTELTEFEGNIPGITLEEDMNLKEGQFVRNVMLRFKLLPDNE